MAERIWVTSAMPQVYGPPARHAKGKGDGAGRELLTAGLGSPAGRVPDRDFALAPVAAARGEAAAVGAEGDAHDGRAVPAQRRDCLPGRRLPDLDRAAPARRG